MVNRREAIARLACAVTSLSVQDIIPQKRHARIIIDNDFAGDPDGLVALAHQLLSPTTRVVLVTSTPLNPKFTVGALKEPASEEGAKLARELIRIANLSPPQIIAGPEDFRADQTARSPAAEAIVTEAMREDPLPLFFTCGGPLTNLAAALRLEPRIATRMTVIWIGGGSYPEGGWEYNLATDLSAARAVLSSRVPIWQVPQSTYRELQYSIARMGTSWRNGPPLTRWLYSHFTHPPDWADVGGTWPLGDSPLVLLTALSSESSRFVERPTRIVGDDCRYGAEVSGRSIRVYESLDVRLVFDDMEALFGIRPS